MFAHDLARQLFALPGADVAHTRHLLAQAAALHARLLHSTVAAGARRLDQLCEALGGYLRGAALPTEKRFLLDDPQLTEALHALSSTSSALAKWDAVVAPGCCQMPLERRVPLAYGRLGNIVAAVLLRRWRNWCGEIELATDEYGRIHFPFCNWALALVDERSAQREVFADQILVLRLDRHEAQWLLPSRSSPALASLPRHVFDTMFIDDRLVDQTCGVQFAVGSPRLRFERACRLGGTEIRFEPIFGSPSSAHAQLTGGIVETLLAAIEQNAPRIFVQLGQCIRTIRGFELPEYADGQIASFSTPTSPGVIGFNVPYSADDQPRLCPLCFMWLGHELGHTLHYLIDDVAFLHHWQFLENAGERTPLIPRYGRSLQVRTLFQIPYVHLFEWWLLMLFHERGYAGLPWEISTDPLAAGEEVRLEIEESFELIAQHARLTPAGRTVIAWLRGMASDATMHWRRLSSAARRFHC